MDTAVLGSKAKHALNGGFARVASRYGIGHRVGSLGIDTSKRPYITLDDGAATHNVIKFGTGDDMVLFFNGTDLVFTGASEGIGLVKLTNVGLAVGSSSAYYTMASASVHGIEAYVDSASTHASNSVESMYVRCNMEGVAGVGGRARFHLYTNVALGGWCNALKAFTEFGASGRVTGLASALCAETVLSAGCTQGTYCALEAELVAESGANAGTATSFIYMNASDAATVINGANGYLFELGTGITDTAGGIFEAETNSDSMSMTHVLKIRIAGTAYYIPLNTAKTF